MSNLSKENRVYHLYLCEQPFTCLKTITMLPPMTSKPHPCYSPLDSFWSVYFFANSHLNRFLCQQVLSREVAVGVAILQYGKCSAQLHLKYGLPVPKRWNLWDLSEVNVRNVHNWTQLYATSMWDKKLVGRHMMLVAWHTTPHFACSKISPSGRCHCNIGSCPPSWEVRGSRKHEFPKQVFVRNNCFKGEKEI